MSKFKRTLAMLIAVVMVICALPMTVAAEETPKTEGIVTSKNFVGENGVGTLTLEAYVTGKSQKIERSVPIDVVLVLDVSGSMDDPFGRDTISYTKTTDVKNNGTYYYLDENGEYQRAYFCAKQYWVNAHDDNSWWTQRHGIGSHGGVQLFPLTSSNPTGTQFYVRTQFSQSKLEALKTASENFIDLVAETSPESNIAIVKFSGDSTEKVGNDTYNDGGYNFNYSQVVKELTAADSNGVAELKNAIEGLKADGATRADLGLAHAKKLLEASNNSDHAKTVIMFTDGDPSSWDEYDANVANDAVRISSEMKGTGVKVYTIGCFSNANSSEITSDTQWSNIGRTNRYMNLVSSNFDATATNMNASLEHYVYKGYYKAVTNASDLDKVFEKISQETGGATNVTLTSETVMQDVVSEYFTISEGAKVAAHTETCTEIDTNGNPTKWKYDDGSEDNLVVRVEGKTVTVTNFNYSENWVGSHNGKAGGKKLVLVIQIKPEKDLSAFTEEELESAPTNDSENSGLYLDGSRVADFDTPRTRIPHYKIKHIHDGALEKTELAYADGEKISLTEKVENGYLYGGTFMDEDDYTKHYVFEKGENGILFTPKDKETYCIWEVPDTYLRPKTLSIWQHINSTTDVGVTYFYLMATVDRLQYKEVGFDVDTTRESDEPITDIGIADNGEMLTKNKVYDHVIAEFFNGDHLDITAPVLDVPHGYFAMHEVPNSYWTDAGDQITFRPYWITKDNVKVSSRVERICEYVGIGSDINDYYKQIAKVKDIPYSELYEQAPSTESIMSALMAMPLTRVGNVDVTPVEPEPEPDYPIIIPSKNYYIVTVQDGENEYEIKVAKNNSGITLDYAGVDGMLFAGWYMDGEPADLSKISSDMTVYAKYVSGDYLRTKYIEQGIFRVYGMTMISALDSANYADAGFIINGEEKSCDYSDSYGAFTARVLFGSGVARRAKLMTYSLSLRNASNGDKYEITPYWVTYDGTTVYGTTRTFVYNTRGIIG